MRSARSGSLASMQADDVVTWQEAASRHFAPLVISGTDEEFAGRLDAVQVDAGISLSYIAHPHARVARTPLGIRQADDYSLYLSINTGDPMQIVQSGRVVDLPKGTSTFYASSMPYEMIFPQFASQYVLQIDRARLPVAVKTQLDTLARPLAFSHDGMSILRTYLASLMRAPRIQLGSTDRVMGQAVVDLTAMVMQSADREHVDLRGLDRDSLYLGMMSFIRVNAARRDLSPEMLSERFSVSRRLMYNVFAENDNAPAEAIRAERLRRASVLLGMPGASVGEVANATGFADVATFGRAFGRKFHAVPSDWIRRETPEESSS
jgi:AraC-like DNA-binding protein